MGKEIFFLWRYTWLYGSKNLRFPKYQWIWFYRPTERLEGMWILLHSWIYLVNRCQTKSEIRSFGRSPCIITIIHDAVQLYEWRVWWRMGYLPWVLGRTWSFSHRIMCSIQRKNKRSQVFRLWEMPGIC
jgi:hypothetical protein